MKNFCLALVCALVAVPAFGQTAPVNPPNGSAYFGTTNSVINCVPKIAQFLGAYNFYDCSKLSDNGTQLLYKGLPISGGNTYVPALPPLNVQTGTSYTLVPSDCTSGGVTVALTNLTSDIAVTLPQPGPNFPAGCNVNIRNLSWSLPNPPAGNVSFYVVLTSVGSTIALTPGSPLGPRTSVSISTLQDCWIQSDGTNWTQPRCYPFMLF